MAGGDCSIVNVIDVAPMVYREYQHLIMIRVSV
jgi:hypothetical protein